MKRDNYGERCILEVETACGLAGLVYVPRPFSISEVILPGCLAPGKRAGLGREGRPCPEAERAASALLRYFSGEPVSFEEFLPALDLSGLTPNQRKVLMATSAIPRGDTNTYAELAAAAGFAGAARFVGNVMAKNPCPVFIPCHRVIRSGGKIGKFGGGTELKAKMLSLESQVQAF